MFHADQRVCHDLQLLYPLQTRYWDPLLFGSSRKGAGTPRSFGPSREVAGTYHSCGPSREVAGTHFSSGPSRGVLGPAEGGARNAAAMVAGVLIGVNPLELILDMSVKA